MAQPLQVLYVGERPPDGLLIAELEKGGFEPRLVRVEKPESLASALGGKWDIAIAHFAPGAFGAMDALRAIQDRQLDLPTIVVSGRIGNADVSSLLKAGAADHLTAGNLMRLIPAVERELRAARLRRERVLLEEQFRQAQKMEAVGRLAGGVAHDFNNLLTVITGYSDLLLNRRDLKETQRAALEEIRRAAERGGALTHQLLAFSRRQPLQPTSLRMNELVMHIHRMLRRLIGEDVELVIIPAASRDTVTADSGRLEQVIMNLVVNARDAMPNGGKLTIETKAVELSDQFSAKHLGVHPGRYVLLSIGDTGTGMDQETLDHLFEPFFTTKSPGRGTGLGLASAYGIIRQSGGAIAISSEVGKGTTVRIYLPLAEPKPQADVLPVEEAVDLRGAETILLVEDEARVRKLIFDVLAARGYHVLEATRGEEALRIVAEHRGDIQLLLVDVIMPEMNGPEVVRQVQAVRPGVRVLYMSGYTDEAIVHHGIPDSGAAFLPKPFLPDALARKVREVLNTRATGA